MTKYAELKTHLLKQAGASVPMSFAEIERIIGAPLPPSARKHRPWWSNNPRNSVITHAWLDAGYRTESVDMGGEKLVFRREGGAAAPAESGGGGSRDPLAGVHGALQGTGRVPPGVDLTEPVWDFEAEQG